MAWHLGASSRSYRIVPRTGPVDDESNIQLASVVAFNISLLSQNAKAFPAKNPPIEQITPISFPCFLELKNLRNLRIT
jgi:hypothetical protein